MTCYLRLFALCCCLIYPPSIIWARPLQNTSDIALAKKARTLYAQAQSHWQRQFAELVITQQPDLKDIVTLAMQLQLAQTDLRTRRFFYILETEPAQLDLTHDLEAFANFPWSEQQEARLLAHDPTYMTLERQMVSLINTHNQHPDWKKFRQYFQQTLIHDEQYQALVTQFKQRLDTIIKLLAAFDEPLPPPPKETPPPESPPPPPQITVPATPAPDLQKLENTEHD